MARPRRLPDEPGVLRTLAAASRGAGRAVRLCRDPGVVRCLAPWSRPRIRTAMSVRARLTPPGGDYLLGADAFGRDVVSRLLYAGRVSLTIGLGVAVVVVCGGHRDRALRRLLPPARRAAVAADRRDDGLPRHPAGHRAGGDPRRVGRQRDPRAVHRLHAADRPDRARLDTGHPRAALCRGGAGAGLVDADDHGPPRPAQHRVADRSCRPPSSSPTRCWPRRGCRSWAWASIPSTPTWGTMINEGRQYIDQAPFLILFPGIAISLSVLVSADHRRRTARRAGPAPGKGALTWR